MPELVVCLRGNGSADELTRTVESLERHTPDLAVLAVYPEASADAVAQALASAGRRVCLVASGTASGVLADDAAWSAVTELDADVVLLEVGAVVGPDWLTHLHRAAYRDPIVATASAVHTEAVGVDAPVEPDAEISRRSDSDGRPAPLGKPLWACVYVRRDALRIATNTRWYVQDRRRGLPARLEEVALVPGLVHVLAPTVVKVPPRLRGDGATPPAVPAVRRALAELEGGVRPLRVTVDLRSCAYPVTGTQVHALNLVSALAERQDLELTVVVPKHPHESARAPLDSLPDNVARYVEGQPIVPLPQVFHRPFQIFESHINEVVASGTRLVVTHQDMILDRTPAYFRSEERWRNYTAGTALSLVAADEVAFFSEHARQEALRDGLVDESKTSVVPPGTDHLNGVAAEETKPPALDRASGSSSRPFILFVGNAYFHKNRLFALRVLERLVAEHDWEGLLVSAGGWPPYGSSVSQERLLLRDHENLKSRFVELGRVTDSERQWLYRHAALVIFPSLYEGFGLIPFEAAAAGTPAVYSSRSSVAEYLPPEGALLDLTDVAGTAERAAAVLADAELGRRIVEAIRLRARPLTWRNAADSYAAIYRRAITRPVGMSLVFGEEVSVGARSQMAATEAERQLLLVFKRSSLVRNAAETALGWAIKARRAVRIARMRLA